MSETPSNRRRKGRNAFEPGVDPMDLQPYAARSWGYDYYLQDWLDGWEEAKKDHENMVCEFCGEKDCEDAECEDDY